MHETAAITLTTGKKICFYTLISGLQLKLFPDIINIHTELASIP